MNVLAVDVGGTHVKILASGQEERREFPSGPALTAEQMVRGVKELAGGWKYEAVAIGYPGPVLHGRPVLEPHNLGPGWVGYDYGAAFGCPVKVINDAAMQALGSYQGGKLLFLGLGTGLGSTMILDGIVEPMELGGQGVAVDASPGKLRQDCLAVAAVYRQYVAKLTVIGESFQGAFGHGVYREGRGQRLYI